MRPISVYAHPGFDRRWKTEMPPQAFRSVAEAWFWTMFALRVRHEGASQAAKRGVPRPCEPDDVVRCLDGLYRRKRIDLGHVRVLRVYGERGYPPRAHQAAEREAARLWEEAMTLLEWPLRVRGVVVPNG